MADSAALDTSSPIGDLRWRGYRMPFRRDFATGHGVTRMREGALVTLTTRDGGYGVGEVAPLPEFDGVDLPACRAAFPALARAIEGRTLAVALESVAALVTDGALPMPLLCGVDVALLDALGRAEGRSVSQALVSPAERPRGQVEVNAVLGATGLEATVRAARDAVEQGFRCLKLKLAPDEAADTLLARVAAVRAAVGGDVQLRLDANAAWTRDVAADILPRLAAYNIQYVEQPLPADDLDGMRRVRATTRTPIAADEAVGNLASGRRLLDAEAADVLIVKPQLVGGLRASQRLIGEAAARGVRCVVTTAIESGVGVAAALHLTAATSSLSLANGLATLGLLDATLIGEELPIAGGMMRVPDGPGLGVTLDDAALRRYAAGA